MQVNGAVCWQPCSKMPGRIPTRRHRSPPRPRRQFRPLYQYLSLRQPRRLRRHLRPFRYLHRPRCRRPPTRQRRLTYPRPSLPPLPPQCRGPPRLQLLRRRSRPRRLWLLGAGSPSQSEYRCSPYDSDDYRYSPSVEPRIVEELGGVYGPYTGTWFESTRETDIEHIIARSEAHDSGLCAASHGNPF